MLSSLFGSVIVLGNAYRSAEKAGELVGQVLAILLIFGGGIYLVSKLGSRGKDKD